MNREKMIFFVGATGKKTFVSTMKRLGIGRLFSKNVLTTYENEIWGLDNDAYSAWKNNRVWDASLYMKNVEKCLKKMSSPYLSVIPDKPAQPDSLEFSLAWLDSGDLPGNWNWYLCLQDHMSYGDVECALDDYPQIKGLFLGGTDGFKSVWAEDFCKLAHQEKRKFHYGRTSSITKIVHANNIGCDSCDSSFFLWTQARMDSLFSLIENNYQT